jgi:Fe-S-cluster-containing dehydrogenase component
MDPDLTRRGFLVFSGAVGFTAIFHVLPGSLRGAVKAEEEKKAYNWEDYSYAYLIDTTKCIGCGMCVQACKRENNVPDGFFRTWVERYRIGEGGKVEVDSPNGALNGFQPYTVDFKVTKGLFVPKICNHCKNTPCTQVCPVGASYTTKDGAVLVDQAHCIGCGYCVQACPYGSRYLHPVTHVADKCTWCYHRITKGLRPACVLACPVGARVFGNVKNPDDPVRKIIASERVAVLQPELLTRPNCYYRGIDKEVR